MVREDGLPTRWDQVQVPAPFSAVFAKAVVMSVAGSGICIPDPGFDIVRYDPKDAPWVYNIDHYTVFEDLRKHPHFDLLIQRYGIAQTIGLRELINTRVFVVGPNRRDNH